jgi:hypothetical protein
MVYNFTNINKTNNHLSPQTIEYNNNKKNIYFTQGVIWRITVDYKFTDDQHFVFGKYPNVIYWYWIMSGCPIFNQNNQVPYITYSIVFDVTI